MLSLQRKRQLVASALLVGFLGLFSALIWWHAADGVIALRGLVTISQEASPFAFKLFLRLIYGSVVLGGAAMLIRIWRPRAGAFPRTDAEP